MDIGTPAIYIDPNANVWPGIVIGHDFTMRNVWRSKVGALIRFNLDGTVANGPQAPDDTVAVEKVDTHLFNFLGFFRDGTVQTFLLGAGDLHVAPTFDSVPVFHPSPAGP